MMVAVHAYIHLSAVGHLLEIIPDDNLHEIFMKEVFDMSELNYGTATPLFIAFYVWGTTQDICTHLLNAYYLNRKCHIIKLLSQWV